MDKPALSLQETQELTDALTAPRITRDSIEEKIADVEFIKNGILTICILTMRNGFMQIGKAAPASPENYNKDIGERNAYEDAFKGLWHLEGYLLREKLMEEENRKKAHAT